MVSCALIVGRRDLHVLFRRFAPSPGSACHLPPVLRAVRLAFPSRLPVNTCHLPSRLSGQRVPPSVPSCEQFRASLIEIFGKLGEKIHGPTLAVAAGTFLVIAIALRLLPWLPAALVGMTLAGAVVFLFHLTDFGVKTVGPVPGGLPALTLPTADRALFPPLLAAAAGLALVSFSSLMLTARSFATKHGYDIEPDQDFAALGVANAGVRGVARVRYKRADSRTAMSDAAGKNACRWARGGCFGWRSCCCFSPDRCNTSRWRRSVPCWWSLVCP